MICTSDPNKDCDKCNEATRRPTGCWDGIDKNGQKVLMYADEISRKEPKTMQATKYGSFEAIGHERMLTVDTEGLQKLTGAGRTAAVKIGTEANARVQVGRRIFWNVRKVQQYIDSISE